MLDDAGGETADGGEQLLLLVGQMLEQLTRGWTAEFGPSGVRVNSIAPGITRTEGTNGANAEALDAWAATFPARRRGEPEDIAAAAVWLASDDGAYVHGASLVVDGGALSTRLPG